MAPVHLIGQAVSLLHVPPAVLALSDRSLARRLAAAVFLIAAGIAAHPSNALSGDEPHYLVIAHSLAFDHDLDVANNYRDATLIASELPDVHALQRGNALYPIHDIGFPLLLAPIMRVAYPLSEGLPASTWLGLKMGPRHYLKLIFCLTMAALTGWLARELFLVLRLLGASPMAAWWWALLFAATPPALSHSYLCFTEIPSALLMLVVFRRLRLQPAASATAAVAIGLLAGALILVHIRNIGLVAGLVWLAIPWSRDRTAPVAHFGAFAGGLASAIAVRTAITFRLWGEFVTTPHAAFGPALSFASTIGEVMVRATGLAFDRVSGLFAYAPLYVLALAGWMVLRQERARLARDLAVLIACAMVPILLPLTNPHGWRGGYSPAARFVLPIAPLLWTAVYYAAARASARGRWIAGVLIAIQIVLNLIVWQQPKLLWPHNQGAHYLPGNLPLPAWTDPAPAMWFGLLTAFVVLGSLWYAYFCSAASLRRSSRR